MALIYKNQAKLEAISRKTGVASYRLSDQMDIIYGNRGSDYDELVYLNGKNGDAASVNRKLSDAWTKFGPANGAPGRRADQIQHDFGVNGTYP